MVWLLCVVPDAAIDGREVRRLEERVAHATDQGTVRLCLFPLLLALGAVAPGRHLLHSFLDALPAPDVHELIAWPTELRGPEAHEVEPVLLPLAHRERLEALDQRLHLARHDFVLPKLVEHLSLRPA